MVLVDWLVIGGYALAVLLLGYLAAGNSDTETDYFLAGRREGWLPVAASTIASKLSALTFIGVPGTAIAGNFTYAQMWVGSFLAAYVVGAFLVPEFYRFRVATVYEYLEHRIGPKTRLGATLVFIISRCLASAVRLAGCAIAISVFFDVSLVSAIVLMSGVTAAYVLTGGLRAVIWTDMLQLSLFLAGAVAAIVFIGLVLPGGFGEVWAAGSAADKFRIFDFTFDATEPKTFWLGNLFAFVLGIATSGADQDIAQRALACPDARTARVAVISAGAADLFTSLLFLSVGAAIYAYYVALPQEAVTALMAENRHDYVFPYFIRHELPAGLRGFLVAALLAAAMGSLDSALSGLASSAYFDLGLGRTGDGGSVHSGALIGPRGLVLVFAVILALIAIAFGAQPSILWFGLQIMGYTYGGLLGLFVVAALMPKWVDDLGCVIAVMSSIVAVVVLTQWGIGFGYAPVAWPWAVVIGAVWTVVASLALGVMFRGVRTA